MRVSKPKRPAASNAARSVPASPRASSINGKRRSPGTPPGPPAGWTYTPAPETAPVVIAPRHAHLINGQWREPREGGHFSTFNPATGAVLSEVAMGSAKDVDDAIVAARAALPTWAAMPGSARAKLIFRVARLMQERARELAVLESMDSGKPIKESRDVDVPLAAAHFFYHAGWADKLQYAAPGSRVGPIGVCGQIIPWNFPLLMAAWKLAPALACGNTCVLKPAETTPLTALRLGEILLEAEIPPGVVNIVTGDGTTGAALVEHPGVDKVAFTGSTPVGKRIASSVARQAVQGREKSLTLELGGKSPHLIFEDASLDQAVEGVVAGIFFNQGEVCCAGSRLLVQEGVYDAVVAKLRARMRRLRVGDPLDKNTDVGAINSPEQLGRIRHYLREGAREGATLELPGGGDCTAPPPGFERGSWCRPCFFRNVQPSNVVAREEIFGPVLALSSFRTPEEAISRANNTPFGLAAGVWTDKGSRVFEVARRLRAGVVWCNTYNQFDPASPFGGYQESGFGREGGRHGLRAYLRVIPVQTETA